MITELTPAQTAKFAYYREKWLEIGLSTEPITLSAARPIIDNLYTKLLDIPKPEFVVILDSPLAAWLAAVVFCDVEDWRQVRRQVDEQVRQVKRQVRQQVRQVGQQVDEQVRQLVRQVGQQVEQVRRQVDEQVWRQVEQVRRQVRRQVDEQVGQQVNWQVGQQVWQVERQVKRQVRRQVDEQVKRLVEPVGQQVWQGERQVKRQVRQQVDEQVWSFVWPYCDGQFTAPFFAFMDYLFSEVIECECEMWPVYLKTSQLSLIYSLPHIAVLAQKPTGIHFANNILHSSTGPVVEYADGFSVWCLNGTRVPQWLVEKSVAELNPLDILALDNAQQRAEGVRKIGVERLWHKCCQKILDKNDKYELGLIPVGRTGELRPYLRMQNPSVPELWHVEGVHPACETIQQALNYRRYGNSKSQTNWNPKLIT